jgi:hypothetical protein
MNPRTSMDAVEKGRDSSPCRKSNSNVPVVQLVARRYAD